VVQRPNGTFVERALVVRAGDSLSMPLALPEGLMAVYENAYDGSVLGQFLHVSTDGGSTWRTLRNPAGGISDGTLLAPGWDTWPAVVR
jgi:hypothetical protein